MDFWIDRWQTTDIPQFARLYKLTDSYDRTMNSTQWGDGEKHEAPACISGDDGSIIDSAPKICNKYWIHAYTHPVIAVLLNRVHANFPEPNLWECEGNVKVMSLDKKVGCSWLKTLNRIDSPRISPITRVKFAITCAWKVYKEIYPKEKSFAMWSGNWLTKYERIGAIDTAMGEWLLSTLKEEEDKDGVSVTSEKKLCLHAAHSAACAAEALDNINNVENGQKLVEFMAASSAVFANRVAHDMGIDFDLIDIAEEVMAAPREQSYINPKISQFSW